MSLFHRIHQPPRQRGGGVDALARDREPRGALPPDAPHQAHAAARTGDQAEAELRQLKPGIGPGDHPATERGQLSSRTDAGTVQPEIQAIAARDHRRSGRARAPHRVRGGGIGRRAELGEIAARAEVRSVTGDCHALDRWVGDSEIAAMFADGAATDISRGAKQ